MSQFDQLVKLRTWELDEKRRVLGELQREANALLARRREIEEELEREQSVASGSVEASMTYNAYARAVMRRREQMDQAIAEAESRVEAANEEVRDAFGELRKAEIARDRYDERERIRLARIEQAQFDEMAQQIHRRNRAEQG